MQTLQIILDDMSLFDDWTDKYAYLIDLGRNLPPFPKDCRTDAYKVRGCTSQVWLTHKWEEGKLHLQADSDALIVKGLLGVLLVAYNGKTAAEVQAVDIKQAFTEMELNAHLTPNRRNGFTAMVGKIKGFADE
ncbi:MAG: SufE family protein [Alphaproteobacteria bacterium]|nr:SufE family protein [Alphaproteobacteria bacterium]MDD9919545.1 SufE family protein [Alphaproteobacteria bacterium]